MNIVTKPVEYKDGSQNCIGYLAWDETYADPKPCVLINHAWGGLDGFAQDQAIQMAALGYVGFALDNYGDGALPETTDEKMALMGPLKEDRAALLKRLKAGVKAASALEQVDADHLAAIGFCFGGLCALDMARAGLDLKAAISFHGLLDAPKGAKPKKMKSKILVAHGWDDPMVPHSQVTDFASEMSASKCEDWQFLGFGNTTHAFMVPEANDKKLGLKYHEKNAQRAALVSQDLLNEVFGMHGAVIAS
jgi:dienelactone hydrolase